MGEIVVDWRRPPRHRGSPRPRISHRCDSSASIHSGSLTWIATRSRVRKRIKQFVKINRGCCECEGVAETKTDSKKKKEKKEEEEVEGWGGSTEPSKEQINRNGTLKQT